MYEKTSDLGLSGSVVNGRVLLDPLGSGPVFNTSESFDPPTEPTDPGTSFVAVNAPFDPRSVKVETEELVEA